MPPLSTRALFWSTAIGTVLQVVMVTLGHSMPTLREYYAVGGMGFSLIAGILYTVLSTEAVIREVVLGGLIAGAICALIGIAVSLVLGDVPASLLLAGTGASAVTGAVGGWLGRLFATGRA